MPYVTASPKKPKHAAVCTPKEQPADYEAVIQRPRFTLTSEQHARFQVVATATLRGECLKRLHVATIHKRQLGDMFE